MLMDVAMSRGDPGRSAGVALVGIGIAAFVFDPTSLSTVAATPEVLPYALGLAIAMLVWTTLLASGIHTVGAVTAAVVSTIEPVLVALVAFFVLSEGLYLREVAGGVIVMGGVLFVSTAAAHGRSGNWRDGSGYEDRLIQLPCDNRVSRLQRQQD